MNVIETQRERMRQYLLGALPEAEQTTLEDEFLNDDEQFEQMVAAENELVDAYVRSYLSASERRQFEQHYLAHPARLDRLRFAQALISRIDQSANAPAVHPAALPTMSWWSKLTEFFRLPQSQLSWAMSAALVLVALAVGVIYWRIQSQPVKRDVAITETPKPIVSPSPSVNLPPSPTLSPAVTEKSGSMFASLTLSIGSLRGESNQSSPRLMLTSDVEFARLQLTFRRQDYAQYSVSISPATGAEVWRKQGLRAKVSAAQESLTVMIPATKLPAGEYVLTVRGLTADGTQEDVGKSSFRVIRK